MDILDYVLSSTLVGASQVAGKESTYQCRRCRCDPWVGRDALKKEMATHSSILALEIPWTESLVGYSPWDNKRVRYDLVTKPPPQQGH